MAGTNKRVVGDDEVYEATNIVVPSGVVVIPHTGTPVNAGKQGITVAGDAAKNVLGVSAARAVPVSLQVTSGTDADGYPVAMPFVDNELVTVYAHGVVNVTYTAVAVAYGAKLAAAANGQVRAWITADGADAIIGVCKVVGGMSAAGGVGLMKIEV